MKSATLQLIELAEHLSPTGEIGDGTVARFHELAALARFELPTAVPDTRHPDFYAAAELPLEGV
jgi:hypothetical protein